MRCGSRIRVSLMLAAISVCVLGARDAGAADKITFVTDFGYNGRHAYYFVALGRISTCRSCAGRDRPTR